MGTVESSILLQLVGIPGAAALGGYLLARCCPHRNLLAALFLTVGVASGFFLADWFLRGSTTWWPADATRRIPYLMVLAAFVGILESSMRVRTWLSQVILVGLRASVAFFLAWVMTSVAEPRGLWLILITLSLTLSWTLLALPLDKSWSWLGQGCWALIAGLSGGILTLSGSASLGLVSVSLAVMLGLIALLHLRWPVESWQALAGVFLTALYGLLLGGQQFAELPLSSALLLATAPLVVLLLHGEMLSRRYWLSVGVILTLVLLLLGGSAWLARPVAAPDQPAPEANPYDQYFKK